MTDDERRTLLELTAAATPGPWYVFGVDSVGGPHMDRTKAGVANCHTVWRPQPENVANAAFIAAAQKAVPTLLAEVERLRVALRLIHDHEGHMCSQYEICQHKACDSSHRAWEIAAAALRGVDGGHLRAAENDAYRRGQEDMRKRARSACEDASEAGVRYSVATMPILDLPEAPCKSG